MLGYHEGSVSSPYKSIDDFVLKNGGQRAIKRVLIANNGIGAVKLIRSVRRWANETFGNERAVQFVAMATPEDLNANAEYIRMADEFVEVPGGTNNNNYANVKLIISIAESVLADAVFPGWGHASENPTLPDGLEATSRKIIFIGPPGKPMRALGDKIGSTIIAQSASVNTIPWSGDGITVDYKLNGCIPDDIYKKANVETVLECRVHVERIGLPVMIKASEGGGGKGIRKLENLEGLEQAYRQVQGEIPGSPIFVMKMATKSRHLEVQLLADNHGNAVALSGRDCSIQRRHQKIIEEGPPLAAPKDVWNEMKSAAVRLAKEVGYSNAGTVEYLYLEEENTFAFLELNPRLQVEHPVTEMITGVNIPAAQLMVAMGIPLNAIPDIRRLYNRNPYDVDEIDFENEKMNDPKGHVIACRITAENPDTGFQPTSGAIRELNFRSFHNVWAYFSVDSSGRVHEFADSQFGHIFSWGETREKARKGVIQALREFSIRGDIRTTTEYLIDLCEDPDFVDNRVDTSWLDTRIKRNLVSERRPLPLQVVLVGAVCQASRTFKDRMADFMAHCQRGQVAPKYTLDVSVRIDLIYENVKYNIKVAQSGPTVFAADINGSIVEADVRPLADGGFLVLLGGKSQVAYMNKIGAGLRLVVNGATCLFTEEYDPTTLRAAMAGKLARWLVTEGSYLKKGTPYAEVEVMKMYMPLLVPESGRIHFSKSEGAILEPGDLIAHLDLDDPAMVKKAEIYSGEIPDMPGPESALFGKAHFILRDAIKILKRVLHGYHVPLKKYQNALDDLSITLTDFSLPLLEFEEKMAIIQSRLPSKFASSLKKWCKEYKDALLKGETSVSLDVSSLKGKVEEYLKSIEPTESASFITTSTPLIELANRYANGIVGYSVAVKIELIKEYLGVEALFEQSAGHLTSGDDVISKLREENINKGMNRVWDMAFSHNYLKEKNKLIKAILTQISFNSDDINDTFSSDKSKGSSTLIKKRLEPYIPLLEKLANLSGKQYAEVTLPARHLLMKFQLPSADEKKNILGSLLKQAILSGKPGSLDIALHSVVENPDNIDDQLLSFFDSSEKNISFAAFEAYLRRVYAPYVILEMIAHRRLPFKAMQMRFHGQTSEKPKEEIASSSQTTLGFKSSKAFPSITSFDNLAGMNLSSASSFDNLAGMNSSPASGIPSLSDINSKFVDEIPPNMERDGVLAFFSSLSDFRTNFESLIELFPAKNEYGSESPTSGYVRSPSMEYFNSGSSGNVTNYPVNALHIAIPSFFDQDVNEDDEVEFIREIENFLETKLGDLEEGGVRRLTLILIQNKDRNTDLRKLSSATPNKMSMDVRKSSMDAAFGDDSFQYVYTFRHRMNFSEDSLVRHLEPSLAYHLELQRLSNFKIKMIPTPIRTAHVYQALALTSRTEKGKKNPYRFFVRAVVREMNELQESVVSSKYERFPGPERAFVDCLDALELSVTELVAKGSSAIYNHIYLNIIPSANLTPQSFELVLHSLYSRYRDRLGRLGVAQVEFKFCSQIESNAYEKAIRLTAADPTGYALRVDTYTERTDPVSGRRVLHSIKDSGKQPGPLDGLDISTPYVVSEQFETQRANAAASSDTLYCYDFISVFRSCLTAMWQTYQKEHGKSTIIPNVLVSEQEFIMTGKEGEEVLELVRRPPGLNKIGMVAWLVSLYTPEYPKGRQIILIANDITFKVGSFGTEEDRLFELASSYARKEGIPRIYLAANSGARIGLAEEVKSKIRAAWLDPSDPTKGFEYLYVNESDYKDLSASGSIKAVKIGDNYRLTDVIGSQHGIGVENLRGSGAIAGETSRAYRDCFTLTYVTGRCVGIGAYLVRLGQRTIQKSHGAPIILTGYEALNKLMGSPVYNSNDQLGGIKVMHTNGITHLVVHNDYLGIMATLKWLAFVPKTKYEPLPLLLTSPTLDVLERDIDFIPPATAYDPRHLIAGYSDKINGSWIRGFFDRNSWIETMDGWAKTVITGRARLGGIPMGVIVTENRTVEKRLMPDPAAPQTGENVINQAGNVWFPDSAMKTATAIKDFNGESLPLMIFANWRGFSGGTRDMVDEILKFGSMIVDALVEYKQPVFVYIVPQSQLRGGAWVVVDPTINSKYMEMYAAPGGRGNVLEPSGITSIKFRERDLSATAHRLDPELIELDKKLRDASAGTKAHFKDLIIAREAAIMGVYQQIAENFGDLHDTPGRMLQKKVIREIVEWKTSRSYFYWRLKRRLSEIEKVKLIVNASKNIISDEEALALINIEAGDLIVNNDKKMVDWLLVDKNIQNLKMNAKTKSLKNALLDILKDLSDKENDQIMIKCKELEQLLK